MRTAKGLFLTLIVACFFLMVAATGAKADIMYTPTPTGIQQTANNPCVIGDPSCLTNTKNVFPLPYTSASGPCASGNCDFYSPVYVASDTGLALPNLIPTDFKIGVDDNYGTGQGKEVLDDFIVWHCTTGNCNGIGNWAQVDSMGANGGVDLDGNNGNGWTDGILTNFQPLISGDKYKFEAIWHNDTDGMEQFWIMPTKVPEPGTLTLLACGLLCLAGFARRRLARI